MNKLNSRIPSVEINLPLSYCIFRNQISFSYKISLISIKKEHFIKNFYHLYTVECVRQIEVFSKHIKQILNRLTLEKDEHAECDNVMVNSIDHC
jgi:hypothetical protein